MTPAFTPRWWRTRRLRAAERSRVAEEAAERQQVLIDLERRRKAELADREAQHEEWLSRDEVQSGLEQMRQEREQLSAHAAEARRRDAQARTRASATALDFESRLDRDPGLRQLVESERRVARDEAERRRIEWDRQQAQRRRDEMRKWDWD